MSEFISKEIAGDSMTIRFSRPELHNPLSREVVESLHSLIDSVDPNSVSRVIFTGSGASFASGANLNEIAALSSSAAPEFARLGQSLMKKIDDLPIMTIAAVNGHCFGGALDLALACDARIAAPEARFAHPGASLGIITGWGGTQRLPRLVGSAIAKEMFFTAAPIDAERAFRIGLIDEIADNVLESALKTLR